MNRNRGAGKTYLRAKRAIYGGLGHAPPQKIFKIQGVFGVFWCNFGTYELKAQLTSAHTQTLRVRVAAAQKERAPLLEPDLPRRKCKYAMGVYILAYGSRSRL